MMDDGVGGWLLINWCWLLVCVQEREILNGANTMFR